MSDYILRTSGLAMDFRGFKAVQNVNLNVRRGTIHALIGPNGAGKTTLFNLITKFLIPSAGTIRFNDVDITREGPGTVASRGIVRSFQISAVFAGMTVLDNVRIALRQKHQGNALRFWRPASDLSQYDAEAFRLLEAVDLVEFAHVLAGGMPYGRKRALEVATTLALDPELLLLDEPMAGLGREDIDRISDLIRQVAQQRTVLMVEHNLAVVARLCDRITVLQRGEVLAEGSYTEVAGNPEVRRAYIGTDAGSAAPVAPAASRQGPAAGARPLLEVDDLHAWYGESHVLHGVNLRVAEGEVVSILGRNGAGRSTTLKAIIGVHEQRSGSVRLGGAETISLRANDIAALGAAWCPEERAIFASLTVAENMQLPPVLSAGGMTEDELFEMFPNLRERLDSQGTKLSGGEQQMLALARILRSGARVLLLDEVTEGLAPVIVEQIGRTIRRLKTKGYTILLVEQNLRMAIELADRHYVMEHGVIVDEISSTEPERIGGLTARLAV